MTRFLAFITLFIMTCCVENKPRKPRTEIPQVKIDNECQKNLSSIYLAKQQFIQNDFSLNQTPLEINTYDSIVVMPVNNASTPDILKEFIFSGTISFYVSRGLEKQNLSLTKPKKGSQQTSPHLKSKQSTFQDPSYTFENFIKESTSYDIHKKIQESEIHITDTEKYFSNITDFETTKKINDDDNFYKFIGNIELKIQESLEVNLQKAVAIKHLNHEQDSGYQKAISQGEKDISSWMAQMKADHKEWKFLKQQSHIVKYEKGKDSILSLLEHIENRYKQIKPQDFEHQGVRSKADDLADEKTRLLSLQWFQAKKIHFLKSEELASFQKEFNKRKVGPWQEIAFRAQDRWEKYRLPVMFVLTTIAIIQLKKVIDASEADAQTAETEPSQPQSSEVQKETPKTPIIKKEETTLVLTPFRPDQPDITPTHLEIKSKDLIPWTPLQTVQEDLCEAP
ncbi:MAG: hypothetical protein AB8C84_10245 [Oligoflexales bacterium]